MNSHYMNVNEYGDYSSSDGENDRLKSDSEHRYKHHPEYCQTMTIRGIYERIIMSLKY